MAWLGLEVSLFLMLAATAAAAALLLCDAWFDVTTAHTRAELVRAVVLSLVTELPLACLTIAIARRPEHALARSPLEQLRDLPVMQPAAEHAAANRPFALCSHATSGTTEAGE